MTWLVTGAAGFIGSNLCKYLLERGHNVVGLDNFFSGKHANVDRLERLGAGQFRFIEGDILDASAVSKALDGVANVAHLAAQVSVQRSIDKPEETHAINVTGFLSTFRAAALSGAKRFVYASSCAVYGDNPALPLSESERPTPLSPYAASKLINEITAAGLRVVHPDLQAIGLRFFNIFGAWQDADGGYAAVIPKWTALMREGKQPIMYGEGNATRDFCHVDNVCLAITRAAEIQGYTGNAFNVGTGVSTSLIELYRTIKAALEQGGMSVPFETPSSLPWRAGDILHSVADIRQARTILHYVPPVNLATGLAKMLSEEHGLLLPTVSP